MGVSEATTAISPCWHVTVTFTTTVPCGPGSVSGAPTERTGRRAISVSQAACKAWAETIGRSGSMKSSRTSSKRPFLAISMTARVFSCRVAGYQEGLLSGFFFRFLVPDGEPALRGRSGAGNRTW